MLTAISTLLTSLLPFRKFVSIVLSNLYGLSHSNSIRNNVAVGLFVGINCITPLITSLHHYIALHYSDNVFKEKKLQSLFTTVKRNRKDEFSVDV